MIDIHPPQHGSITRRDFFIHLATVVLGILIALGLEQTVEYFHHRQEVADARESLRIEREQNRRRYVLIAHEFERQKVSVEDNLTALVYLQQHPHAVAAQMPHRVIWHIFTQRFNDAAWQSAQRSGITTLMPPDEVTRLAALYRYQDRVTGDQAALFESFALARRYTFQDSDISHLTPAQVTEEIDLTKSVLMALYNLGTSLRNMSLEDSEFGPAPDSRDLLKMMHDTDIDETTRMVKQNIEQQRSSDALEGSLPVSTK